MTDARLAITAIGWRGEGIAQHAGVSVFVAGTLPGETVTAHIADARGQLLSVDTPSPDRVPPFCTHYGTCGGCQLQHWAEAPYRTWKRGIVEQALAARGISAKVNDIVDAHGAGRRRISLHVRRKDGVVTAGFMAARTHRLHDLDQCPILVPALRDVFGKARSIGARLGDCDVAFTATPEGLDAAVRAERKVVSAEHARLAGLARELDLARLTVNAEVIATARVPRVAMGKAEVPIPPASFLQATAAGEDSLAALVTAALGKSKQVADLFCGCGPFTFRLAERARVHAFDSDRQAVAALAAAARATPGLKPIAATVRDLFREPLVTGELKDFDCVVLDPPRAGAEAQARQLAKSRVARVISVSCDAASFARDAEILIEGGYRLDSVTPVDQFKWSSHIETVASFTRSRA